MNKPIFSGENSREFWQEINDLREMDVITGRVLWSILYSLGCKLQELESQMKKAKS